MSKTAIALSAIKAGNIVKGLSIIKTFRIGFTKAERCTISRACDILRGNERFYQQLGFDPVAVTQEAIRIVKTKYNL